MPKTQGKTATAVKKPAVKKPALKLVKKPTVTTTRSVPPPAAKPLTSIALPTREAVDAVYAPKKSKAKQLTDAIAALPAKAMKRMKAVKDVPVDAASDAIAEPVHTEEIVDVVPSESVKTPEPVVAPWDAATSPVSEALRKDGFKFQREEVVGNMLARAWVAKDGRAALHTRAADGAEQWMLKLPVNAGDFTGGVDEDGIAALVKALTVRPSIAELAAAKKPAPSGPPPNVVRAVEMLGGLTTARYDLDSLKGDKNYGRRVQLLKKLLSTDRVLVEDSGLKKLIDAFHSAVGAQGPNVATKTKDFAARCKTIVSEARAAKAAATKAEAIAKKRQLDSTKLARTVPGKVLDLYVPPTDAERRAQRDATVDELFALIAIPEQHPIPKADVDIDIIPGDVGLLEDPNNGIVMLQLERENSQGALVVYNNGKRVAAGVVSLDILKTLRPVSGQVDLIKAANQLLNPLVPSVPVSPVAARLLTAVTHCKELLPMATKKATSVKKFEAPAAATTKTVKAAKAPKAEKPVKAAKADKEAGAPRKASTYRLLTASKKLWESFDGEGQKGKLIRALVKAGAVGAKAAGVTTAALVEATGIVDKNVAFYMSIWQGTKKQEQAIVEKVAAA
jgi:hypothetical protein